MAEEKNVAPAADQKAGDKKVKNASGKPNFFVRVGQKIAKIYKDTVGELKKVVWTPKKEVFKSFKLVIATIVAVAVVIAVIDLSSSWIINSIAGLIG
ncbi:MAG: preprotein translocase subunit SecE [Clostridia bacterium]|nr:preprotein translocase subunit SecE [Clostridia bacterium]